MYNKAAEATGGLLPRFERYAIPLCTHCTISSFLSKVGHELVRNYLITRESSCFGARGIPTAAYQVFHLLSCTGGTPCLGDTPTGGVRHPCHGVPHLGYPPVRPGQGGTPSLPVGYPTSGTSHQTWLGYPTHHPHLDLAGVPPSRRTWLGYLLPIGCLFWVDSVHERHFILQLVKTGCSGKM